VCGRWLPQRHVAPPSVRGGLATSTRNTQAGGISSPDRAPPVGPRYADASVTWMTRGACRGEDPELFFPVASQGSALSQISAARAVCQRCPVAAMCLAYALQTSQTGIWGGTTQEERRAMRERHRRSAGEQTSRLTVREPAAPRTTRHREQESGRQWSPRQ
jgi:WhiB family redox-sensing transcriptional regulator